MNEIIHGKTAAQWTSDLPLLKELMQEQETA